jgi:tRNA pseudouridine13 synthase
MDILEARRIENQNFKEVAKQFPKLFRNDTFVDDQKFLKNYGITIPEKKNLPKGYIKLWPQDFIVEEISLEGEVQDIYQDSFVSKEKSFFFQKPIIWGNLVKCGLSTIEAVKELAKKLNIESSLIKYAGIKDKFAITSQLFSIRNVSPEKLHSVLSPNFFIKNIFSRDKEISVGSLKGNQFTIFLRTEYTLPQKNFFSNLQKIQKEGFYNFYYLQRFGTPRLIAPLCGFYLLKGDYERAVFTEICQPGPRELPYLQNLRKSIAQFWGNWEEIATILESFPLTFRVEKILVDHLINHPHDFLGALRKVPSQVRLWVDSFNSLLFNRKISFFLEQKKELPKKLPFLSKNNKETWLIYEELLRKYGFSSPFLIFKNLSPFPFIKLGGKARETKIKPQILDYKIIPEGVILNFNLPKGCYATTFFSHLFNLVSGTLPQKISNLPIDTKATLKKPSLDQVLNRFQEVVYLPTWKYSWRI